MTKLLLYPKIDDLSDFEFNRDLSPSGKGSYIYDLGEIGIKGKGIVVYLKRSRERDEFVDTSLGVKSKCEEDLIICGYRKTKICRRRKRVRLIPTQEREFVKSKLLKSLVEEDFIPRSIEFW